MTFSYTDDAIVSTSPTGRHLSTVIKRPVVLMSGWNEHAEAVCKVLNDLAPAHNVGALIDRGYLTDYRPVLGSTEGRQYEFNIQPQAKVGDFDSLEKRVFKGPFAVCPEGEVANTLEWDLFCPTGVCRPAPKGRRGQLIALLTSQLASVEAELARAHEKLRERPKAETAEELLAAGHPTEPKSLKSWVDYGKTIYAYAVEQGKVRDALAERVKELSAEVDELKKRAEPTFCVRITSASGEQYRTTGAKEAFQLLSDALAERTTELDEVTTKLCAAQMLLEKPVELSGETLAALASMKPGGVLMKFGSGRPPLKRV